MDEITAVKVVIDRLTNLAIIDLKLELGTSDIDKKAIYITARQSYARAIEIIREEFELDEEVDICLRKI